MSWAGPDQSMSILPVASGSVMLGIEKIPAIVVENRGDCNWTPTGTSQNAGAEQMQDAVELHGQPDRRRRHRLVTRTRGPFRVRPWPDRHRGEETVGSPSRSVVPLGAMARVRVIS